MEWARFKQVIRWSEFGKLFFIGESLFITGYTYLPIVQMALEGSLQSWMRYHDLFLYPYSYFRSIRDIALFTTFILLPFFLAWLIQWKLVRPLGEEKVPSQKWFHLLLVTGLSLIISIEVYFIVLMPWIDGSSRLFLFSPSMLLSDILGANLLFSSLAAGTLCVAVARHKSKNLEWNSSNVGARSNLDDVLRWVERGMLCFIFSLLSASAVLILQNLPNNTFYNFSFYFQNMMLWTLFFWDLFLFALLGYEKLLKPLKRW